MAGGLYDQVCSLPVLTDAWKRIKTKRSAGGLDRVSVGDFERDFNRNFEDLREDLIKKKYVPEPLERIAAPKKDGTGETRPLSLPSVRDKIVQQAVRSVIEPLFNAVFLDCSYAYRPGKGTAKAFKRVNHFLTTEKRRWAVLADFDKFFDTMDQAFVIEQVSRIVQDTDILRLIRMWVKIGFVNKTGDYSDSDAGVGQGSVISPLLSNIYAHPLDEYMVQKNYAYVRYSDNIIILCHSMKEARTSFEDLTFFLKDVLKLSLNNDPRPIKTLEQGFVFLGIYYHNDVRAISHKKLIKIRGKIKHVVSQSGNPGKLMEKLCLALEGIKRYYGVIGPEEQFIELDNFLVEHLTPVISGYIKRKLYRNLKELVIFLAPLTFLSELFNRDKEARLREFAGMALNASITKTQNGGKKPSGAKEVKAGLQAADRAVSNRKRKYLKDQGMSSEVVVSTHGAFVGKTGNNVVVKLSGKVVLKQRVDQLKNLVVAAGGVTLSSDLIRECCNNKIAILFMEAHGPPYAIVQSPVHTNANLGFSQLKALENGMGLEIARRIVQGKIRNQLNLIKFYARSRKKDKTFKHGLKNMEAEVERLEKEAQELDPKMEYNTVRDKLFSVEGRAASSYWAMVKQLLSDDIEFIGRKRKGADDLINSLLNYGYGILYARVWRAASLAGLNPHLSFLHAPNKDSPSLVFDLIEEFRCQAVDRAIFTMITRGETLELDKKKGLLTDDTRQKVIENVLERLTSLVPYKGKNVKIEKVIRLQSALLAECLSSGKTYRPFIGRY